MAKAVGQILGYADRISVAVGETIDFMVSCERATSYSVEIRRIINGDPNPKGPGYKEAAVRTSANGTYSGRKQISYAGSYGAVPDCELFNQLDSFSFITAIWPTTPMKGEQVVVAHWDEQNTSGFQLCIDATGGLSLVIGNGRKTDAISTSTPLLEREWYLVGCSYDDNSRKATVYQCPMKTYSSEGTVEASKTIRFRKRIAAGMPLTMAAITAHTVKRRKATTKHFNGKLDSPRLANRSLGQAEMNCFLHDRNPQQHQSPLVAAWDFSLDIPDTRISDISTNGLHGEVINLPTRAMTGCNWTGEILDWTTAPHQYGAIHFHDDDFYDCEWEVDFSLTIPRHMKSGCYAAHLSADDGEDYIPFFVRPAKGQTKAKIAYLAETASYMAYANYQAAPNAQFMELLMGRLVEIHPWEEYLSGHPEFGASLYDVHSDGSGVCYSSRLRPMINMRPGIQHATSAGSGLWAYNADTHLTGWLEHEGLNFDVITDEDIHEDGLQALSEYNVIVTGTHPEYTTKKMWNALYAFTQQGGRLMYMGGNGFYWHTAYHNALPGVIEVRRGEDGTRNWRSQPGESYHSFDGDYSCLWRHHGKAPQTIAGTGFIAQGFDACSYFRRTPESEDPRIAWAFEGISIEELIGNFGLQGGGAAGLEVDIADRRLGTPPHALTVAKSEDLTDNYLLVNEEQVLATPIQVATANPLIRADLVFYETTNGGAVFSFSSIAWCGSLPSNNYNNNVARLTGNILRRFADDEPFVLPTR